MGDQLPVQERSRVLHGLRVRADRAGATADIALDLLERFVPR
jgi:hypothetical protein